MRYSVLYLLLATMLWHIPLEALARIKLITLPPRERVEIQLDHARATLVEEERIVPLVQGVNQVDFAWANTQIDPDTLVFRVLGPADEAAGANDIKVLSVSYPPNENALIWNVAAARSGAARVRISYVIGGLDKSFTYRALADKDEKSLQLSQYLRIDNFANEEYGDSGIWAGFGERLQKQIGIGETKQVLLHKYTQVPVTKTYSTNAQTYLDRPKNKLRVPMHYVLRNDQAHGLGLAALPYGKVRIFVDDGKGSSAFIGEDWGQFTPLDDELKLYLGVAQDIVVVRTIDKSEQKHVNGNLYHHEVTLKYEIENFKNEAVILDIHENIRALRDELRGNNGRAVEWELLPTTTLGAADADKSTYDSLVFHADLPARKADSSADKVVHYLRLLLKNEW
jgi:hypothetical protein